ncbi:MAG: carboxy terminal-processing peptidase [Saprospiraceae bacterium]|nr:carboxy terminal-processing peptidase [Saprospiraceae bacterium]MCC6844550.1 carboxy terminal-processing peptidase [Saprospiraceae bacterium]HRG34355.1 carboxy terminal-processing peptidase [Saprospiraceae bacterium]
MKYRRPWYILLPLLMVMAYFTTQCKSSSRPLSKEELILQMIYKQSQTYHYNPPIINDDFSKKAYDQYLDNMDSGKRFLTKADLKAMESYRLMLDDQFKEGKLDFFEKSNEIINAAVAKTEAYYKEFIEKDFNLEQEESIELDPDKRTWPDNDKELKEFWRKSMKYDFISKYYDDLAALEKDKKTRSKDSIFYDIRKEIRENMENWYKRLNAITRSDRFELYVNSLIHVYDPHTDFLNPKEKEDFNITMSGKLEGIGARLQADHEYTKVTSIVPGGPAWKQKELEANDIITGVQQEGKDVVDIKGMLIDDVVKMIRGKKGTKVTLKVKKPDGSLKDITIVRDEVIMDEGFARSALVSVDSVLKNVGYIKLPKFYADFENPNGASCAKDVQKELRKLRGAGAQSLILDLRNNGGGSLQEVVEMAGLFFKDGPVVQVRDRERISPYADSDPGVDFDGPVAVLVNSNSASASEILAACLQDYKRAVIIGGEPTFGKGSVQRFINFDRMPGNDEFKPLGEMKITIQKYYRVNGGSVQLKGVEPDILIPDAYSYIENGEKEYENPMPYDVIKSLNPEQEVFRISNFDELKEKSKERVKSNQDLSLIDEQARKFKEMRDKTTYPLNFNKFKKEMDLRKEESKKYEQIGKNPIQGLKADNLKEDLSYINMDSSRVGRNEDFLKSITKDLYIMESINVLNDIRK